MQETFAVKEKIENKYGNIFAYISSPNANGVNLKFTNQKPTNTNLESPVRGYNPPKTYAQNNFFTLYPLYAAANKHTIYAGKAVLYDRSYPTDIL